MATQVEPSGTVGAHAVSHTDLNGVYFYGWARHRRLDVVWDLVAGAEDRQDVGRVEALPRRTQRGARQALLSQINCCYQVPEHCTCDRFAVTQVEYAL